MTVISIPSFTFRCDFTATDFLSYNSFAVDLKEYSISDIAGFERFFQSVKEFTTIEELDHCSESTLESHLNIMYGANDIYKKNYDAKRDVRSLFVAVLVQKRLFFLCMEDGTFVEKAERELFDKLPWLEGGADQESLVSFYIVLREVKKWKTHAKWEKFAMVCSSIAAGDGIWYCPGGGATAATRRRLNILQLVKDRVSKSQDAGSQSLSKKKRAINVAFTCNANAKKPRTMRMTARASSHKSKAVSSKRLVIDALASSPQSEQMTTTTPIYEDEEEFMEEINKNLSFDENSSEMKRIAIEAFSVPLSFADDSLNGAFVVEFELISFSKM